jgi:hypothetical protein
MGHIDSQYPNAEATSRKWTCFNSNLEIVKEPSQPKNLNY